MKSILATLVVFYTLMQVNANPIIDPPVISELHINGNQISIELYIEDWYWFPDLDEWNLVSSIDTVELNDGITFNYNEPFVITNSDFKESFEFNPAGDHIYFIDDEGFAFSWFEESFLWFGNIQYAVLPAPGPDQSIAADRFWNFEYNMYDYCYAIEQPPTLGSDPLHVNARGRIEGFVYDLGGHPVEDAVLYDVSTNEQGYFISDDFYCRKYYYTSIYFGSNQYGFQDTITVEPYDTAFHSFTLDTLLVGMKNPITYETPLIINKPNPFSGKTTFIVENPQMPVTIDACLNIYNLQGTLIEQIELDENCTSFPWDASSVEPGVYLYSVVSIDKTWPSQKMIIY